jgi:hypothetical protein
MIEDAEVTKHCLARALNRRNKPVQQWNLYF